MINLGEQLLSSYLRYIEGCNLYQTPTRLLKSKVGILASVHAGSGLDDRTDPTFSNSDS